MDKYAKVEELLKNYKMTKIYIENIQEELEYLKENIGIEGISYDNVGGGETNKISDIVGDIAISNAEAEHYLNHQIECNQREIDAIDRALEGLEETERIVLTEKYINSKQWWEVSGKVHLGERQCRRIRKRAIDKVAVGIFGKE